MMKINIFHNHIILPTYAQVLFNQTKKFESMQSKENFKAAPEAKDLGNLFSFHSNQ